MLVLVLVVLGVVLQGGSSGNGGYFIGAGIAILVIGGLGAMDALRLARVRATLPAGSAVTTISAYIQLVDQVQSLYETEGAVPANKVRARRHYTLAATRGGVAIYAGIFRPKLVLSIESTAIYSANIETVLQDKWRLRCIRCGVSAGKETRVVDFCIVDLRLLFPTVVRDGDLSDFLARFREALHFSHTDN